MTTGILQLSGRVGVAAAIKAKPLHLAWGTGNGSWTTAPAVDPAADELVNEVGRRLVTSVDYIVPDAEGEIFFPGAGYFSTTTTPTNRLYVLTRFDFGDADDQTIREIGLFADTVTDPLLPVGQKYFVPSEVDNAGFLIQLQNLGGTDIIYRDPAVRETIQLLIVF